MTQVTIRYENQTNRVIQTYWGTDYPEWTDKSKKGTTVTTTFLTQQDRKDALTNALNSVEAGADYDPDTERPVGMLCYDPDADELYAEVEIQPLSS